MGTMLQRFVLKPQPTRILADGCTCGAALAGGGSRRGCPSSGCSADAGLQGQGEEKEGGSEEHISSHQTHAP